MNIQLFYENGKGSVVDEYGRPELMDYIVDEEHTTASGERENDKVMQVEKQTKAGSDDKVRLFKLLFEKCLSAVAAAKRLGVHVHTAQKWAAQYEGDPDCIFEKRKKTGRPCILNEEHKKAILECIDENPSIVLDDTMKHLRRVFTELKARFQPIDRNSEEKIQERLDWIRKWEKIDMDFTTNCIFLDESAFHINLKCSMAWSKKGSPAVVTVPKTRAKTITILGVISAQGLIKCSLRLPQPPPDKKRK
ncbi:hypothetical protein G6F37_011194 [Rhizopus arrhizus]|nr:hypothetical protein G6F38_011249 [Rhizopus arrhizus]KAG1150456.1 hypothetical protein G6F37_011194 [Rhizopus arrhizus]